MVPPCFNLQGHITEADVKMSNLAQKNCSSCQTATRALTRPEFESMISEVPNWEVVDDHSLRRVVKTKNFAKPLALANKIGEVAESEGHHPDLLIRWGELRIEVWTHKVDGLTEADFVLAAKIDELLSGAE
jgi:4a-hydroxytetrahydrobiopterin dehydratase